MTDEEIMKMLEGPTGDASRHQHETLRSILERQGAVRYLRPHLQGFNAPVDAATFRRAVPLSSYDDYVDHINSMANGLVDHDQPLLSVDPLLCFFYRCSVLVPLDSHRV
jgi:auxin responsive GH3 family protein